MSVSAKLADGSEVRLAARLGATVPEVVAAITKNALTGSAVPLADAVLEAEDGREVRYADVSMLVEEEAF